MHSLPVLVLSFAVCFLSPCPDSLPRPFLRCFSFEIFRFPSASFRQLSFHFRLLSPLLLPFRSSRFRLTVASALLPRSFRPSGLSSSLPAGFPSVPSDSAYSALLFVSFRPSLFRSHSCFTGACLLSGFFRPLISDIRPSLPHAFFRPLSAFRIRLLSFLALPFRFFPNSSCAGLFGAPLLLSSLRFPRLPSAGFPSALFPFLLTWFSAPFLFVLPNFAPAAVPLVLAFVFCFVSSASSLGICPLLPFPFGPFRFRL